MVVVLSFRHMDANVIGINSMSTRNGYRYLLGYLSTSFLNYDIYNMKKYLQRATTLLLSKF